MLKKCLFVAGILVAVAGCEKREAAPTPAERQAAATAQVEAQKAETAKARADRAVDVAKERQDIAKEHAEAAKDKAEDLSDKAGMDWKGPEDGWRDDWATFADGADRTVDKGDYTIERGKDGTIVAWRKTKQVAGSAFAELKDAALVTQVKAKLAADEDTRAHAINVDAEDHVVTLRGNVASTKEAAEAVRIALATPGTERVVSHLTWKKTPAPR